MVVLLPFAVAGYVAHAQEKRMERAAIRPGWKLVFQDEFNGKTVDTKKWNLADPWGRERNRELQAYVQDAFEVKNGILRIKAQKRLADYDGKKRAFASGMMTTYQKFSQRYGRFEIRCRVPRGKGLWPAFWLLPEPLGWPPEIDVLEVLGDDTKTIHFTHHWKETGAAVNSDHKACQSEHDLAAGFHVVAMEWTPKDIRWELDGKERHRSVKSVPQTRMYLLLNLAVGGDWPGPPDDRTVFPAYFDVDYVRVYQKE
jgi:beta-glucanase (GH16 family)